MDPVADVPQETRWCSYTQQGATSDSQLTSTTASHTNQHTTWQQPARDTQSRSGKGTQACPMTHSMGKEKKIYLSEFYRYS